MKTRNTKQKQMVMDSLCCDKTHPTIQQLYEKIQQGNTDIGQATIYRNINKMVEDGKIKKIRTLEGIDRYDGDIDDHCHLVCGCCGKFVDVFDKSLSTIVGQLEQNNNIKITNHSILLEGICSSCMKEGKNEEVSL